MMTNRIVSDETRLKMSISSTGRKHTDETKKKISNIHKQRYANGYKHPMIGKKHTEEAKKKIKEHQSNKKSG